jgi:hypothetical protein
MVTPVRQGMLARLEVTAVSPSRWQGQLHYRLEPPEAGQCSVEEHRALAQPSDREDRQPTELELVERHLPGAVR